MTGLRRYFEFVRFSHTIFALPFALASVVVAARGWPGWRVTGLVVVAMVCARTAAMGFNRIVDREYDARNPRTKDRHLPAGRISLGNAWLLTGLSATGLVVVSWFINRLCFYLSPVALAVVGFYSLTKRFTDFTHLFLGLALGLAPVGAWLAVTGQFAWTPVVLAGAVVLWLTGFDIIYATQDYEFDRQAGLRSLPVRWGIAGSLRFAMVAHTLMVVALAWFGRVADLGAWYFVGLAVIAVCLAVQHGLATRQDPVSLNVAFFRMNAIISVVFLVAVTADIFWR